MPCQKPVIGIDVGGLKKGFHVALLQRRSFETGKWSDPGELASWCLSQQPAAIAIDAPCKWSTTGRSRLAERELCIGDERIQCFNTPTMETARQSAFYEWVFNGQRLYEKLMPYFPLYDGAFDGKPVMAETFPHAIACYLSGRRIDVKPKAKIRRQILFAWGYDIAPLKNIDYVDAALCVMAARSLALNAYRHFGNTEEGHIVVPAPSPKNTGR